MDTVDKDVPDITKPATVEEICDLYQHMGIYQNQLEDLKRQMETENETRFQELLEQMRQDVIKRLQARKIEQKELLEIYKEMVADGEYYRFITTKDFTNHKTETIQTDTEKIPESDQPVLDYNNITVQATANIEKRSNHTRRTNIIQPLTSPKPDVTYSSQNTTNYQDTTTTDQETTLEETTLEETQFDHTTGVESSSNQPLNAEIEFEDAENIQNIEEGKQEPVHPPHIVPLPLLRNNIQAPNIMRENVPIAPKRRNQYIANATAPLNTPILIERKTGIKLDHEDIRDYKSLENQVFQCPITHRLYQVTLVYYDLKYKCPAAYRRVLDDQPPHPHDEFPWRIEGPHGILRLIEHYRNEEVETQLGRATPYPKSEAEMLELQTQDPNWQPIINNLLQIEDVTQRKHEYTTMKTFYIPQLLNGTNAAMRMCHPAHGPDPENDPIVMPTTLVYTLIHMYHDQNGHYPGINKTKQTIRLKYWWPTYRNDITSYINSCQFCQWRNRNRQNTNPPVQAYDLPAIPFGTTQIDLTELVRSRMGNLFILVIKCALTKYVELVPIIDKTPEEVAIALINRVFMRHGSPNVLISDNGHEFVNQILEHINAIYKVKHITTSGYHPQANGLVENHNQTLKNQLKAFANEQQNNWDEHLDTVQFAYNTTVHSATGFSPHMMLYGREAKQPHEDWIGKFTKIKSLPKYVNELVKTLQLVWQTAAEHKPTEVERMNRVPVRKHTFVEYQVGDRFYLAHEPKVFFQDYKDPNRLKRALCPKLQTSYSGPYVITRKFSPVLYESKIDDEVKTVHAIHMKPDANNKYYNLHRSEFAPVEPKKRPELTTLVDETGKPIIPHRVITRLKALAPLDKHIERPPREPRRRGRPPNQRAPPAEIVDNGNEADHEAEEDDSPNIQQLRIQADYYDEELDI
jgi:hypothetical protein